MSDVSAGPTWTITITTTADGRCEARMHADHPIVVKTWMAARTLCMVASEYFSSHDTEIQLGPARWVPTEGGSVLVRDGEALAGIREMASGAVWGWWAGKHGGTAKGAPMCRSGAHAMVAVEEWLRSGDPEPESASELEPVPESAEEPPSDDPPSG